MRPDTVFADQRAIHVDNYEPVGRCSLTLRGARVAVDAHSAVAADVEIKRGRIQSVALSRSYRAQSDGETHEVDLSGYLLLPGLINAHDHLDFSLFPKLGRGPYPNAEQWAKDIYHPDKPPIREHLDVPKRVRLWWGGIRNLLCGVTTVCHHNDFREDVFQDGFPVRVLERYAWSHSLQFGGDVASAFRTTDSEIPFVIHLGEGTDSASGGEVFELDRRGFLDARTVIVHGVALDDAGHDLIVRRGAALIWCPGSNLFTLGATLSPKAIGRNSRIALGSDSPLTAGDLLDQIAVARELNITAEEIFDLVTTRGANVLRLQNGEGSLSARSIADLIAIPDHRLSPAESLAGATKSSIELVLLEGLPHLLSRHMISRFPAELWSGLETVSVDECERLVRAPIRSLLQEAEQRLGTLQLDGKQVRA